MSSSAKPTLMKLVGAVVTVLGAALAVLSLVTGFQVWLTAALIAASIALAVAWYFADSFADGWRLPVIVLSPICAAVLVGFAAEGVRGVLTEDTPSTHRYFVVQQVFPKTAPDDKAGEAVGTGLLDAGETVDVVCLRDDSWAKLHDGSWVPERAVQAEVDAVPAPHC